MSNLINFVLFQIGWFACVLGAANNHPWAGSATALVIVAAHLFMSKWPRQELKLLVCAALIGFGFDTALCLLNWVTFPNGELIAGTAPHWMVALWLLFASTLNRSLSWLKRYLLLAVVFGALGGPLAYYAGSKLGAINFVELTPALIALSLGWATITPLLVFAAKRFNGFANPLQPVQQHEVKHA